MSSNSKPWQWSKSLWFDTAIPLADQPALQHDIDVDVAVVGAGYTGLSAALHLSEAGVEVAVIDQAQPGWGCSGRNGGQVNPNWKVLPDHIRKFYSAEEFARVISLANQTCDLVFDIVERYQIDCQAIRPGYVLGVIGQSGLNFINTWVKQWKVVDAMVEPLGRQAIADLLGTDYYDGGMLDRRGGSVQPLSYARGLAKACMQNNVPVYGDTKAEGFTQTSNGWKIKTPNGNVTCRKLIIGLNGYTDGSWRGLAQTIVPVATMITATEPLSQEIADSIIPARNAVSESGGVPHYYRVDENNRMVFGGRGTVFGKLGGIDTRALRKSAIRLFPQLASARWEYDWGGYVAMTTHHRPMLLQLDENVYSGLGYNGRGLSMATMMGKQLSLAARGLEPELALENPRKIPLHGFYPLGIAGRVLGGHLIDYLTPRVNK